MAGGSLDFLFLGPTGAQCGDARASVALGRCWPTVYAVGLNTIVSIFWNLRKLQIGINRRTIYHSTLFALFLCKNLYLFSWYLKFALLHVQWSENEKRAKNDYFLKLLQKIMIFIACFAASLNCWVFSLQIYAYSVSWKTYLRIMVIFHVMFCSVPYFVFLKKVFDGKNIRWHISILIPGPINTKYDIMVVTGNSMIREK